MFIEIPDSDNESPKKKETIKDFVFSDDSDSKLFSDDDDDELSSPLSLKDSYSSLTQIVDDPEFIDEVDSKNKDLENKEKKSNDVVEKSELQNFKLKKTKEKKKKEEILQKIFEEAESKNVSDTEMDNSKKVIDNGIDTEDTKKTEEEQKLSDYIKQKLGKRKRKKDSTEQISSSDNQNRVKKSSDSITDFFDRGDKKKTKHSTDFFDRSDNKRTKHNILNHNNITQNLIKDYEKEKNTQSLIKEIKKEKNPDLKIDSSLNSNSIEDEIENSFLSSENEEEKDNESEKSSDNNEFEDIKNKMNELVPNLIDEINKNLDTQKALMNDDNKLEITLTDQNTNNTRKKKTSNKYTTIDIDEDEDDDISNLDTFKKIHITFYGYKLVANRFVRIMPITLEVPETAKFKTIFKAYCTGTKLKEEDMLFNYNNIKIYSTSTLKGLYMTSSLENYRIDVFYKNEYPKYKEQLESQRMMNEAEQQKEKEKQAQSNTLQNPLLFNDDDDDFSSDRHINIIIQEKNKKEVKVLIHNNATVQDLGIAYLNKLSLDHSLLSRLCFYFDGQKLDHSQSLREVDIDNQDIVDLKISN